MYLSPKEVATILGLSERGAARLMASGAIASARFGRLWRTTGQHVDEYVAAQFDRYRRPVALAV